ncbi:MAG: hypothetical protein VR64_21560 [Desulfatitalea sp. BRH_c12]|nr:MAG: hypothetical protein VR64_21560 [Desulfatitalea sp. BRH_c12]
MKFRKVMMAIIIGVTMAAFMGCATTPSKKGNSGFLGAYPQFEKGKEGIDQRYVKQGVNFKNYKKIMMDEVVFFFKNEADYKGIQPSEISALGEEFHKTFVAELGDYLTDKPGPGVARMRLAVTNIDTSNPVAGTVTTVVPVGLAVSLVKRGATGQYTGIGSASMEVEFLDSLSNERIAAGVDKAPGGKFDVGKLSPAKAAFEFWAKRLRAFMDQTQLAK